MQDKEFFKWLEEKWYDNIKKRGMPKKLEYPLGRIPITGYLSKRAEIHPDVPAVIYYGKIITYRELDDLANQFANFLKSNGFVKGDFIGLHLFNCPQYLIAQFGALKAGCTVIPLDPLWKRMELEAPMEDAAPRLIVTQDLNYSVFEDLGGKSGSPHILTTSLLDFMPENPSLPLIDLFQQPKPECPRDSDFMTVIGGYTTALQDVDILLDDSASLDYTGGTTGKPKGCLHTHEGIIYTRACMHTYFGYKDAEPGSAALTFVPVFHTAGRGLMESLIFSGMTCVLLTRFDLNAVLTAVDIYKVFTMWGPSDVYDVITKLPEELIGKFSLTSLKNASCTQYNVPLNQDLRDRFGQITGGGVLYDITYGLTESLSMNTFTLGFQDLDLEKQQENGGVFSGLLMPETLIKIVDNDDQLLPPGNAGQIAIKDPALSPEYFKRPEETRSCYLPDGFLLTGDLGMYDQEGFFYYKGRSKEIIKVSGLTVSPREIELIMGYHPALWGVIVVGAPEPKYGEIPVAFVIPKKEFKDSVKPEEIISWCRDKMAGYKVPRHVVIRESFPYLLGMKVDRQALQKEAGRLVESGD